MGVFDRRVAFKPFEYPETVKYVEAIQDSYWTHREFSFGSDVNDFHVGLTPVEKSAVKNAMLAISQIEVAVKEFWAKLGDRFPKPEFKQVGITYGDSEIRHENAYSHLLEILGLNTDFTKLLEVPAIKKRVEYLTKAMSTVGGTHEDYTLALTLFSLYTENVSLFGQFAVMKSVNKHRNMLKNIDNVVQATQLEEGLHFLFGAYLINIIKEENPSWFNDEFYEKVYVACHKAHKAESAIVDWIYEAGELPYLPSDVLKDFLKDRFNKSLEMIGGKPQFEVNQDNIDKMAWFDEEVLARINPDFFNKRPVAYSRFGAPISADELF